MLIIKPVKLKLQLALTFRLGSESEIVVNKLSPGDKHKRDTLFMVLDHVPVYVRCHVSSRW